ncbi:MAG: C-type lectin domain-containing protein [Candidatus Hatepunaea meridiana]|nr:C-type lectin domain-containing protein [Candidatus Hatepunaea meridiana]
MKVFIKSFIIILILTTLCFADKTVTKTASISAFGNHYKSIDEAKTVLLNMAKKAAVDEIFGEYIRGFSRMEKSSKIKDGVESISDDFMQQIETTSLGFVRLKGDPKYHQGVSLGEICVSIEAYVTDDDLEKFKPRTLTKKVVVADPNLTVKQVQEEAKIQARITALIDYDDRLKKVKKSLLLPLMHQVKYSDGHFIEGTSAYSVEMTAVVYPIEIASVVSMIDIENAKTNSIIERCKKSFNFVGKIGNREYWVSKSKNSWWNAKKICEEHNGHLVTIANSKENKMCSKGAVMRNWSVWIGLTDYKKEGKWEWITGENVTYLNWHKEQPNGFAGEHYVNLWGTSNQGYNWGSRFKLGDWTDWTDDVQLYFVLEIE